MSKPVSRWDYHIEDALSAETLETLAADGWELSAVDDREKPRYIFRRPAQSFVERVTLEQRARYYESLGLDPGNSR